VPTPSGPVRASIPKGSNTGKVLRLKGKGVARRDGSRGDEYVTLKIVLPDHVDRRSGDSRPSGDRVTSTTRCAQSGLTNASTEQ
jgi:DnaJ-class molecular chaperone